MSGPAAKRDDVVAKRGDVVAKRGAGARLEDTTAPLAYGEAKALAAHPDAGLRALLAARRDAPHEILYFLAGDAAPAVRRAVAANPETPIHAELLLVRDADETVRLALAEKVATLARSRSEDSRPGRAKLFFELLMALARDELVRIRRVIAQAVKDIAVIPLEILQTLAHDQEPSVAAPVLRDSPVLREADLVQAIAGAPASGVVAAVAARAAVGPRLADAVVETGDEAGIAALLANESAQIREETLDHLIEAAARVPSWQARLMERPSLSPRAAARLAAIIGAPGTPAAARAGALAEPKEKAKAEVPETEEEGAETAFERVTALHAAGRLDEDEVSQALVRRERPFIVAALAVTAGLPTAVVTKILALGGAKGITALVWKAGFGMRLATQLQTRLAGIAPDRALYAKDGVDFPLSAEQMRWHLEFFDAA